MSNSKMKRRKSNKGGQSTIEYAVLIGLVVLALVGMCSYVKRALQGRWMQAADSFGHGALYQP